MKLIEKIVFSSSVIFGLFLIGPEVKAPDLEKAFLNLVHNSGHPGIKLEKKINFEQLYNSRFN